jgi:hypothetical protein
MRVVDIKEDGLTVFVEITGFYHSGEISTKSSVGVPPPD